MFFSGCYNLKSISIPDGVTSIGVNAFASCSSLSSITIPNSVTSIGSEAFAFCEGLKSIEIPSSVESIGWGVFEDCGNLSSITLNWNEQELKTIITNGSINASWLEYFDNLTTIYVPNDLVDIYKEYADELNLPENVTIKEIPI